MGITQNTGASSLIKPGVIDNTAARPASPYEGQMVYEKDTDMLAIWNGTAWRYIGSAIPSVTSLIGGTVLQVVYASYATDTANASTTYADTGLTATITPKSTSSKILVSASIPVLKESANASNAVNLRLFRASTQLRQTELNLYTGTALLLRGIFSDMYLDSPASTSALIYKYQFANYFNGNGVSVFPNSMPGQLTLMEIAA
jgi:hypothetical protein